LIDITVGPGSDAATMLIDVAYRIRATNAAANLVYPFYLDGGAAA
jgi:hypothetical protein